MKPTKNVKAANVNKPQEDDDDKDVSNGVVQFCDYVGMKGKKDKVCVTGNGLKDAKCLVRQIQGQLGGQEALVTLARRRRRRRSG